MINCHISRMYKLARTYGFNTALIALASSQCFDEKVQLAIILKRKRKLVALLLLSYRCIVALDVLPHGALGWSAVCDCGIS